MQRRAGRPRCRMIAKDPYRRPRRFFQGGFVDQALGAGERVRCRRGLHPVLMIPGIILILPAAFMVVWPSTILLGVTFAGLVIGAFAVLTLTTSEVAVTDRRIIAQVHGEGLLIPIGHVMRATSRTGWLGARVGFGALVVELRLPQADRLVIRGVTDPGPLATAVNDSLKWYSGGRSDWASPTAQLDVTPRAGRQEDESEE